MNSFEEIEKDQATETTCASEEDPFTSNKLEELEYAGTLAVLEDLNRDYDVCSNLKGPLRTSMRAEVREEEKVLLLSKMCSTIAKAVVSASRECRSEKN